MGESAKLYVFRVDANGIVGSGHMMRCLSIAEEVNALGGDVEFLVSDDESTVLPIGHGFKTTVLSSESTRWEKNDGLVLGRFASEVHAVGILVDSYAVTDAFFSGLRKTSKGISVGYIDDLYTFELGRMTLPAKREIDIVFNYGFYQCEKEYLEAYANSITRLCLGLEYAPIRAGFARGLFSVSKEIKRILITTGSTNPDRTLERMTACAHQMLPNATLNVVVGSMSEFDLDEALFIVPHRAVHDLSLLMTEADIAISAAGTTLYELCAIGLPTIAVPIVDNQMPNADGFVSRKFGLACPKDSFDEALRENLGQLATSELLRSSQSMHMREAVDGTGSLRIAKILLA